MAAPVWVAPGSRLFLVAYESADGKPYAFALSDLDVAHKLASRLRRRGHRHCRRPHG